MHRKSTYWHILGSLLLTGALLYAVFSETSFAEFTGVIAGVDRQGVLLYLFISVAAILLRAARYRFIVGDAVGEAKAPSYPEMLVVTVIRNGFVDFLPARLGEASFLYVCTRYGVPLLTAAGTFGVCIALDIIVLLGLFALLGLGDQSLSVFGDSAALSILVLLGATAILSTILYYLDVLCRFSAAIVDNISKRFSIVRLNRLLAHGKDWLLQVAGDLQSLKAKRRYPLLVLLTAGLRAAKYGSLYVLLVATISQYGYGYSDVSPLLSSTAFIAAEASASLPVSGIMGFGAYEAAWSAIFSVSNLEIPAITRVIFVVHIITQVVGYSFALLGLAVFFLQELRSRGE